MKWLKRMVSKLIWKIAGISPAIGNFVMDVLGEERYLKVMRYQAK